MENENIFIQKESYQPTFRTYTGDDELKKITKAALLNVLTSIEESSLNIDGSDFLINNLLKRTRLARELAELACMF